MEEGESPTRFESELSDIEEEINVSDKDDLEGQSESDSDDALGEDSTSSFSTFPVTFSGAQ
ncbi:Hypothetical predicted protein, partial [Pelobates cultripes]